MKPQTQAKRTREKIQDTIADQSMVIAKFGIVDNSVQNELRVSVYWRIYFPVDEIHYPKNLAKNDNPLWVQMREIAWKIYQTSMIANNSEEMDVRINARTKTGPERRTTAKVQFEIEQGKTFLEAYKKATTRRTLSRVRKEIEKLQGEQKALLPELREANSEWMAAIKNAKAKQKRKNTKALKSGRFWEADKQALKDYFHPPFGKNHLCDISEQFRAALYSECESTAWKAGKGDWRHKLIGTGNCYLCGIDDNGDEWGYTVRLEPSYDNYDDPIYSDFSVEEAMATLFDTSVTTVAQSYRQGDLLFHPEQIPETVEMHQENEWEIRESHVVKSPGLMRNGRYISSNNPINIEHTSHAPLVLNPGSYRLYVLRVEDAD